MKYKVSSIKYQYDLNDADNSIILRWNHYIQPY